MPAKLTKQQREDFLRGRHVAVLTTIGPDGAPVSAPIWYLYRGGNLYFRTAENAVRTYNVRRDARVCVCVQEERPPYKAVIVHGTAEVAPPDDRIAKEMPRHYLGFIGGIGYQQTAREAVETGAEVSLIVRPERYTTFDFTLETPGFARVWLALKRVLPPWL